MPERIELHRTKGWRKPADAIVVARPTRWGNPFPITEHGRDRAIELYRRALDAGELPFTIDDVRTHLAGHDLACWCKPEQACHADVLLSIANLTQEPPTSA